MTVEVASKAIQASTKAMEEKKQHAKAAKRTEERKKVLAVLSTFMVGKTAPDIAEAAGLSADKTHEILHGLLDDITVVRTQVVKEFGSGKKKQLGCMLWRQKEQTCTDEQMEQLRNGVPIEDVLGVASNETTDHSIAAGAEG